MTTQYGPTSKSARTIVKPILKKLTQSEKNSLDLDRPTDDQDVFGIYGYGDGDRSSHDVVFYQTGRRGYHTRSTSGTSQFSTATTGSGARVGSFVHPFQQTPRPYTPPLATAISYQNSLRDSEHSNSPAPTEEEEQARHAFHRNPSISTRTQSFSGNTTPIVGSQPLHIQTRLPSSSRLALATSHTNLSDNLPLSPEISSPTDNMSPASAFRTSLDKGFRIRSRSEVDTRSRSETIREARRKFAEKEQAKDEKAAQEEIRAMEKRNQKLARQIERSHRRSSASDRARSKLTKSELTRLDKDSSADRSHSGLPLSSPFENDDEIERPRRSQSGFANTKYKTHGTWTKFLMWFRTRLIHLGGKKTQTRKRR